MLLSDYLNTTRFLLEDSLSQIWSDSQLTLCINLGRDRVVADTICCRSLQFVQTVAGQPLYPFSAVYAALLALPNPPKARSIFTVIGVNFQVSASYIPPLKRLAFSEINAIWRVNPTIQSSQPVAMAVYGTNIYIYPPPAASTPPYQFETDAIWLPNNLANPTDAETAIPDPLTELVPLMAARWAHYFKRSYEEAEKFIAHYELEKAQMVAATPPWSVDNYYAS